MEDYYKKKALKYYLKYKNLEKMMGGNSYNDYFCSVKSVIEKVSGVEPVLTGSGALTLLFKDACMNDLLEQLERPNDIDLLYTTKGANYYASRNVGNYVRTQDVPQRSVTFTSETEKIKSFDLTQVNKIDYVVIDGINVINPHSLLCWYLDEDNIDLYQKNKNKINLLKTFLCRIKANPVLNNKYALPVKNDYKRKYEEEDDDNNDDNERFNFAPRKLMF